MTSRLALVLPLFAIFACAEPLPDGARSSKSALVAEPLRDYYVVLQGPSAIEALPRGVAPRSSDATRVARARIVEIEREQAALEPALAKNDARVVFRFTRLANAIQVLVKPSGAKRLERLPGVVRVEPVPVVKPVLASALPVVGAPATWSKTTPLQGDGVTVGTIDSGIDYTHADFGGPGTPDAYTANDSKTIEPGSFPTAKVVGGWDFVGDDYDAGGTNPIPVPDPDPLDCVKPQQVQIAGGHGTHVAGIAAGMGVQADGTTFAGSYDQSLNLKSFLVAPGVAPKAKLYSLKVFGCNGSTTAIGQALERATDPNQDGSFDDRLDVVNASLGTAYGLEFPTTAQLVGNLAKVGTVFVVAAGNDGQAFFAVASPSNLPQPISVAASSDNQFVVLTVTSPSSVAGDYVASEAGATKPLAQAGNITGNLVAASPSDGCSSLSNASAVAGNLVLVDRGTCKSSTKFQNAVAAGAAAVVLIDDQDESLPFSVGGGDPGSIAIPGVMIKKADGDALKAAAGAGAVSGLLDSNKPYTGPGTELLAGFSSRGPSSLDDRLKPEISAPGSHIDSARVGSGTLARRSDGTSMACPFVTGAAALVRQGHPEYTPGEVKEALMNGAVQIKDLNAAHYSVSSQGSGRLAVDRSVDLTVLAGVDPDNGEVGVSFGSITSADATSAKKTFSVTNKGSSTANIALSVEPTFALAGVSVGAKPTSLTLAPAESASVELDLSFDPTKLGDPGPDPATDVTQYNQPRQYIHEASGLVRLTSTTPAYDLVVPYLGNVRAAGHRSAVKPDACTAAPAAGQRSIAIQGASAEPTPVVTAFQLGTLDDARSESDTNPAIAMIDLRAVGISTNLATATSFDKASVYFGIAVTGEWTTPARGPYSVVYIEVDKDKDGTADYQVRAEPLSAQGPYGDVLVVNTYDLSTQQPSQTPRFLNMVDASTAATQPFHNSVVALPAYLIDLGLAQDQTSFNYAAVSLNPNDSTLGERTDWQTYDPAHPAIDPAKLSADGRPLYTGDGPVLVDVAADAAPEAQKLLLLHHNNVNGERFEVVDLASSGPGNVALKLDAPATLAATAKTTSVTLSVTNGGSVVSGDVKLSGTVTGGAIDSATPSQGTCKAGSSIDCDLGTLDAAATATVTLALHPTAGASSIAVSANVASGLPCESSMDDNKAAASIGLTSSKPKSNAVSAEGGGCGCRSGAEQSPARGLGVLIVAALGLVFRRRRARG